MIDKLLETTDRQDAHASNLRNAAYEALMELIKNSPKVSAKRSENEFEIFHDVDFVLGLLSDRPEHNFDHIEKIGTSSSNGKFRYEYVGHVAVA